MAFFIMCYAVFKQLKKIKKILNQILMTQEELLAKLTATADQVDKIKTEVQALKDLVAAADNVPTEVVDAVNRLADSVQAVDDLNPDA